MLKTLVSRELFVLVRASREALATLQSRRKLLGQSLVQKGLYHRNNWSTLS
jgi:hypothetical protein